MSADEDFLGVCLVDADTPLEPSRTLRFARWAFLLLAENLLDLLKISCLTTTYACFLLQQTTYQ